MKNLIIKSSFILAVIIGLSSCRGTVFRIKGSGDIVEQTLDIENFTGVSLQHAFNIEIVKGEEQKVVAVGHANIIERIKTDVVSGVWQADLKRGRYKDLDLTIKITSPEINTFKISGAGDIATEGFENLSSLTAKISGSGNIKSTSKFTVENTATIKISGSGNINLEFDSKSEDVLISGSGSITTTGSSDSQEIDISGSGEYIGFEHTVDNSTIDISGSGDIETTVNTTLDITIPGSGNVYYKGTPTITQKITGSGSVINAN